MGSLSQCKEHGDPLQRGHFSAGKCIGDVGLVKAVENADYFLHDLILRWFFGCVALAKNSRNRS